MIVPIDGDGIRGLLPGRNHGRFHCRAPIEAPEILAMLADLADRVAADLQPSAWLIVEGEEAVGLCSILSTAVDGAIAIGYGIGADYRRRGHATQAVRDVVSWAYAQPHIPAITAETVAGPGPSARLLSANGFQRTGQRIDAEDGLVDCWRRETR